jgi:mannan endo-1,4-beta-mannosidase
LHVRPGCARRTDGHGCLFQQRQSELERGDRAVELLDQFLHCLSQHDRRVYSVVEQSSGNRYSGTAFSDTGLAASTTYNYLVEAVDSDGTSAASSQASAITKSASSGGATCTVNYTITPQNSSSFGATVAIENQGTTALSNWILTWSFANGQTISSSWNGTEAQSGANVTVSEQSGQTWENIPAGGTYSGFGFNGTWNGITNSIPAAAGECAAARSVNWFRMG